MSANLTVYSMAMTAEEPYRVREAERAYQAAMAEAASERRSGTLVRRLANAIQGVRQREITGLSGERPENGRVTIAPLAG